MLWKKNSAFKKKKNMIADDLIDYKNIPLNIMVKLIWK